MRYQQHTPNHSDSVAERDPHVSEYGSRLLH